MEIISALLVICGVKSLVKTNFPHKGQVMWCLMISFGFFIWPVQVVEQTVQLADPEYKTILRLPYLHNGISNTVKTTS